MSVSWVMASRFIPHPAMLAPTKPWSSSFAECETTTQFPLLLLLLLVCISIPAVRSHGQLGEQAFRTSSSIEILLVIGERSGFWGAQLCATARCSDRLLHLLSGGWRAVCTTRHLFVGSALRTSSRHRLVQLHQQVSVQYVVWT